MLQIMDGNQILTSSISFNTEDMPLYAIIKKDSTGINTRYADQEIIIDGSNSYDGNRISINYNHNNTLLYQWYITNIIYLDQNITFDINNPITINSNQSIIIFPAFNFTHINEIEFTLKVIDPLNSNRIKYNFI